MPTTKTIHETDGSTVRRVTLDDGTTHDFDVLEGDIVEGDVPEHAYRGDGEPPAEATAALAEFIAEYHDADPDASLDGVSSEGVHDPPTSDSAESAVSDAPESYQ